MASILSDIAIIPYSDNVNSIECSLVQKYGEIIRWSIVDCNSDMLKIAVSYKKD